MKKPVGRHGAGRRRRTGEAGGERYARLPRDTHGEARRAVSTRAATSRRTARAFSGARMNPISRSPSATNKCPSSFAPPPSRAPAARKWQQLNAKRYGTTRKFGYVEPPKEEMPPEVRGETRRGARPPPFPACSERRAKAADALVKPSDEIFLPPGRRGARRRTPPQPLTLGLPHTTPPCINNSTCARS